MLPWLVPQLSQAMGALRPNVIIHLGTNGPPTEADLTQALDSLAGVRRVVLVTTHVERSWQDDPNSRIAAAAAGRPNVVVVDWHGVSPPGTRSASSPTGCTSPGWAVRPTPRRSPPESADRR